MKGYLYILLCANGLFYTGSTTNLEKRLAEHQSGKGALFTQNHLPVELVFVQEFERIDEAFCKEKQVQGWSHKKKEALIKGEYNQLHKLAECKNLSHFR
jgi:putative endonuclease